VRTLIVDEVHAILGSKRGSHLALCLERLEHLTSGKLQRIGLSATQSPVQDVPNFLVGVGRACALVDGGHRRLTEPGYRAAALAPGSGMRAGELG
jgi:ATP-dependent Lhr-like helicase